MHITNFDIETFNDAVQDYLKDSLEIKQAFASYGKEEQHDIIVNHYPDVEIKETDHYIL